MPPHIFRYLKCLHFNPLNLDTLDEFSEQAPECLEISLGYLDWQHLKEVNYMGLDVHLEDVTMPQP